MLGKILTRQNITEINDLAAKAIALWGLGGLALGLTFNMIIRYVMRKRADEHEASMKEQAVIRKQQLAEASGRNNQFASDEDEEAL